MQFKKPVRIGHETMDWFKIGKGICQGYILSPCLFNLHAKHQAGWSSSWNQDCREKYQWTQTCRWYHPDGRKQREAEEPLDEGKRGAWKSWLKTQQSEN